VVALDDAGHDRKPEAAAARTAGPVEAVEPIEDLRRRLGGDARTTVADDDRHRGARLLTITRLRRPERRGDVERRSTVADRVLQQVGDHPVHQQLVDGHEERLGFDVDLDLGVGVVPAELLERRLHECRHRHGLDVEGHFAGVQAGEAHELVDEHGEAPHLVVHGVDEGGVRLAHPVGEVLDHRLEGGDGRTELVGRVRHELTALAIHLGQLGRHLVERGGELAHLVT